MWVKTSGLPPAVWCAPLIPAAFVSVNVAMMWTQKFWKVADLGGYCKELFPSHSEHPVFQLLWF